jgi:hypothetical protein
VPAIVAAASVSTAAAPTQFLKNTCHDDFTPKRRKLGVAAQTHTINQLRTSPLLSATITPTSLIKQMDRTSKKHVHPLLGLLTILLAQVAI